MNTLQLPNEFPTESIMLDVLKKTIEQSWNIDMDIEDIENWLSNFTGQVFSQDIERRIALWLLCNFTYYNEDEINHLCRILYHKLLHQLMLDNNLSSAEDAEKCIRNTAFTSIGRASESGGLILYHFRQESGLDLERFIFPTCITSTGSSNIVCIDDVIMTGGTASRFFFDNIQEIQSKNIYYISLIASDIAIEKLKEAGIKVLCCAQLDSRHQMFSDSSLAFYKYPSLKDAAKQMAEDYGKRIEPKKPLGYKNGQYGIGLFYNIPNNSLPIFWSESNNWKPIFARKEKYQNAKQANRQYNHFI